LKLDTILLVALCLVFAGVCSAGEEPAAAMPPAGDACCPAGAAKHAESAHGTQPPADLPPVEKTDDDSSISIQRQHTMIDLAEGELHVSDVMMAVNTGDKAVVAKDADRGTFRIALPDGAADAELSGDFGPHSRLDGNTAIFTQEFRPGTKQFVLQYALRYDQPKIDFTRRLDYDTQAADFIFPDIAGTSVSSTDFTEQKLVNMGKQPYQYLSVRNRKAGDTLTVQMTMPMPPANGFRLPAIAAVVLAGALIVGLGFTRRTAK